GKGAVSLREADTGKEVRQIAARGPVSFTADSQVLAVADHDSTITFWNVTTGEPLRTPLPGHRRPVQQVQFLPAGNALISVSDDAVYSWQVDTGKAVGRFVGPITERVLSPDGKTLAAVFSESEPVSRQLIGLWDTATGQKLRDFEPLPRRSSLMAMAF